MCDVDREHAFCHVLQPCRFEELCEVALPGAGEQRFVVDARVEQLDMKLFDYHLSNRDPRTNATVPIELGLDQHVATIDQFRLFGDGTALSLSGTVGLHDSTIAVKAEGDANLGILPGFYRDLRSSGSAARRRTPPRPTPPARSG